MSAGTDQAAETATDWETLGRNITKLLEAEPARVDVDMMTRACRELGVPLAQLTSSDFDVESVPWLPYLEPVQPLSPEGR